MYQQSEKSLLKTGISRSRRSAKFARRLAVSWAGTLYIHFGGTLARNGIQPGSKFTLRPSLALSYIGSVTAQNEYRQWILFREAENSGRDRPIHPAALGRKNNRLLFRHPDE